jgi:acyl-coenzyme A thioesterase PaaI-like protein
VTTTDPTAATAELLAAVTELGDALRAALAASVSTTVAPEVLRAATADVRRAAGLLAAGERPRGELSPLDDMSHGVRVFGPVVGPGNGLALPLVIERDGDGVIARAHFGQAYEGPPTYLHGGVSALVMDQVLGQAAVVAGRWGMTVELRLRYRRPVALHTPLLLTGVVTHTDGRRTTAVGGIAAADAPDLLLVEATGLFVTPSADASAQYFAGVRTAAGTAADGRLGVTPS